MPQAMILAAGMGTRLRPLTEDRPKALIEANHRPLIEFVIERVVKYQFDDIIVNLHHHAGKLREFLQSEKFRHLNISFSDESSKLLDTGGGIKKAQWFFRAGEPFLVHNCDIISLIDLDEMHKQHLASGALATLAVSARKTTRPLAFDAHNQLKGRFDEKAPSLSRGKNFRSLAFSGIYLLNYEIFDFMPETESFSIIDVLLKASSNRPVLAFEHDPSIWMDVGSVKNLQNASRFIESNEF